MEITSKGVRERVGETVLVAALRLKITARRAVTWPRMSRDMS